MSFQGRVQAHCSQRCEAWDADVWSFVDGAKDDFLREALLAGELNLLSCPTCGELFFPEATVIYYDGTARILAFILPESYRAEEARWRKKMDEDYEQMRKVLGEGRGPARVDPKIYFGTDTLRAELESEDLLQDEVDIVRVIAHQMKWSIYPVDRVYARARRLPWALPHLGAASVDSLTKGIRTLLEKNDRLESYRLWLDELAKQPSLPPRA